MAAEVDLFVDIVIVIAIALAGGLVKRDRDRVTQLGKRTIPFSNSPRSAGREPGRASQSPPT